MFYIITHYLKKINLTKENFIKVLTNTEVYDILYPTIHFKVLQ